MNVNVVLQNPLIVNSINTKVVKCILIAGPGYMIRQDITKPGRTLKEQVENSPQGVRYFEIHLEDSLIIVINCYTDEVERRDAPPEHTFTMGGRTYDLTKEKLPL